MEGSLLNFYSEEEKKKLLNFRPACVLLKDSPAAKSLLKKELPVASVQSVTVAVNVESALPMSKPLELPQVCEFVRDYVYEGSSGRRCVDKTFCPPRCYGNLALFQVCPTRLKKLKENKDS